jgi:hypothetical protein
MVKKHGKGHRDALEKIAKYPERFGFKHFVSVAVEETLYDKGRSVAEPDLTITCKDSREGLVVHLVEYKVNGNGEALAKAHNQLELARWWYGKYRPDIPPENIHTRIISGTDEQYKDLLRGFAGGNDSHID